MMLRAGTEDVVDERGGGRFGGRSVDAELRWKVSSFFRGLVGPCGCCPLLGWIPDPRIRYLTLPGDSLVTLLPYQVP